MAPTYDCSIETELMTGMRLARSALARGELIVLPTDTVYGIAADAFSPQAVADLLAAKGRGREAPPPVLVATPETLDALAETVPDVVRELTARFWPGALTIVLPAQPSLAWDLGDTRGTVALRMPDAPLALELLRETGPLAVSSANSTGAPAAREVEAAERMFGDAVTVYLDAGRVGADHERPGLAETSSTIVDATAHVTGDGPLRILRHGVITDEALREVAGDALAVERET